MSIIMFYVSIFLVILLGLTGSGILIGFFLHWIIPGVDIGIGIGTGVVAAGFSYYFVARLISAFNADMGNVDAQEMVYRTLRAHRSPRRKQSP